MTEENSEKPKKLLDKAAIRVIRKKGKKAEKKPAKKPADEAEAKNSEEEKTEVVTPKDRLDDLISGMDDED